MRILNKKIFKRFQSHPQWPEVIQILSALNKNGFICYLAGGCVRDALLARPLQDFDVATNATPDQIEALFTKTIAVGKQFGVIRVVFGTADIEVATFRTDVGYSDGRRPDEIRLSTAAEDAQRRDFTINGLFYDPMEMCIYDYINGTADLKHNILRTIGDPARRFSEDKLRMLRAIRFIGQLGFRLDSATWDSIKQHSADIKTVSAERITDELRKLLKQHMAWRGVQLLFESGLAKHIFLDAHTADFKRCTNALKLDKLNLVEFLALLQPQVSTDLKQVNAHLRFSRHELEAIFVIKNRVRHLQTRRDWARADLMRVLHGPNGESALKVLRGFLIAHKKGKNAHRWYLQMRRKLLGAECSLPEPWFSGKDLIAIGIPAGVELGQLLEELYNGQLNRRWPNRQHALTWLKTSDRSANNPKN